MKVKLEGANASAAEIIILIEHYDMYYTGSEETIIKGEKKVLPNDFCISRTLRRNKPNLIKININQGAFIFEFEYHENSLNRFSYVVYCDLVKYFRDRKDFICRVLTQSPVIDKNISIKEVKNDDHVDYINIAAQTGGTRRWI